MTSIGLKLQPFSLIATCVPSPQSIKILFPLYLAINDVSLRYGSGIIPPVPKRQTSSILFLISK
jgi:hypothetical protein